MVSSVCSRSHGQPSGPRRRRQTATRSAKAFCSRSLMTKTISEARAGGKRAARELLLRERAQAPDGRATSGPPDPEILLVLKADAYGHGAVEMAQAAEREGVAHFGVATLHEGIQLRQAGCRLPVVVLSPLLPSEIAEAVAHHLDPTVCDLEFARALSAAAESSGRALRFHVEIDTGMGRIGV